MKKINKFLIIAIILSISVNIFLFITLRKTTGAASNIYRHHVGAMNNNSITIKNQIEQQNFNSELASEGLYRLKQDFNALFGLTIILSVTKSEKIPLGDIMQYLRFIDQISSGTDFSSKIKYINILINDIEKICKSVSSNTYPTVRKELKIIDERFRSTE